MRRPSNVIRGGAYAGMKQSSTNIVQSDVFGLVRQTEDIYRSRQFTVPGGKPCWTDEISALRVCSTAWASLDWTIETCCRSFLGSSSRVTNSTHRIAMRYCFPITRGLDRSIQGTCSFVPSTRIRHQSRRTRSGTQVDTNGKFSSRARSAKLFWCIHTIDRQSISFVSCAASTFARFFMKTDSTLNRNVAEVPEDQATWCRRSSCRGSLK